MEDSQQILNNSRLSPFRVSIFIISRQQRKLLLHGNCRVGSHNHASTDADKNSEIGRTQQLRSKKEITAVENRLVLK